MRTLRGTQGNSQFNIGTQRKKIEMLDARMSNSEHMLEAILQKLDDKLSSSDKQRMAENKEAKVKKMKAADKKYKAAKAKEMQGPPSGVGAESESKEPPLSNSLNLTPPELLEPSTFIQHRVSSVGELMVDGDEEESGEVGVGEGGGDKGAGEE